MRPLIIPSYAIRSYIRVAQEVLVGAVLAALMEPLADEAPKAPSVL